MIATRPYFKTGSIWTPKLDGSEVLYLPMWHPTLAGASPIFSKDRYAHSGAITGAVAGKYGRTFDATDDLIDCGSASVLDTLSAITVIVWINPTSVTNLARILSKEAGWLFYYSSTNRLALQIAHATGDIYRISANNLITAGSWQMLAGTWNGGLTASTSIKLYANAVESASYTNQNASGARTDDSANSLIVGNVAAGTSPVDSIIGEVWIYGRALTAGEIMRKYQETQWRYQ